VLFFDVSLLCKQKQKNNLKLTIMKAIAQILGMTENELKAFYILKVNQARLLGFTEMEAKQIVKDTFKQIIIGK
jgi:isopenicillin N synthase-like dioxygenase